MNNFNIEYNSSFTPGTGVVSQISWFDLELRQALNKLFETKPNKIITGLVINEQGISAYFKST